MVEMFSIPPTCSVLPTCSIRLFHPIIFSLLFSSMGTPAEPSKFDWIQQYSKTMEKSPPVPKAIELIDLKKFLINSQKSQKSFYLKSYILEPDGVNEVEALELALREVTLRKSKINYATLKTFEPLGPAYRCTYILETRSFSLYILPDSYPKIVIKTIFKLRDYSRNSPY